MKTKNETIMKATYISNPLNIKAMKTIFTKYITLLAIFFASLLGTSEVCGADYSVTFNSTTNPNPAVGTLGYTEPGQGSTSGIIWKLRIMQYGGFYERKKLQLQVFLLM